MSFSAKSIYAWYRNAIRNPKYRWWIVLGSLAYLISPVDVIPDFLPIAGQLDDLTILTLLIAEMSQLLTDRIKFRQRQDPNPESVTDKDDTVEVKAVSVE